MANGYLTTHVLDTALGQPAAGMVVILYRLDDGVRTELRRLETNADGRTDTHILPADEFALGEYELEFFAGDYLDGLEAAADGSPRFLNVIPLRFGISDIDAHYHVPLLLSPFGYSTYRGS